MALISDFITKDLKPIESHETIKAIKFRFNNSSFSHLPVLENNSYIGCCVVDDLESFEETKIIGDYKFILEPFFVRLTMSWLDILALFARNETNLMPVLDLDNCYIGCLKLEDVISLSYETPFLREDGIVIIVRKKSSDYSISEVAQIIESNQGKLLGLFISNSDNETAEITIKICLGNTNEIMQTFRRYNYTIISEYDADNYINRLKDHSDYLNKYLSI